MRNEPWVPEKIGNPLSLMGFSWQTPENTSGGLGRIDKGATSLCLRGRAWRRSAHEVKCILFQLLALFVPPFSHL